MQYKGKWGFVMNLSIKGKGKQYGLFLAFFVLLSFVSVWGIANIFGDGSLHIDLSFLSPSVLLSLIVLFVIFCYLDGVRFYFILKALGQSVSLWYIIQITFVNKFLSSITPFASGGGPLQVYLLTKKNVPAGCGIAATLIRTVLPIIFFFITVPLILLHNDSLQALIPGYDPYLYIGVMVIFYLVIGSGFFYLIYHQRMIQVLIYKTCKRAGKNKLFRRFDMNRVCKTLLRELTHFTYNIKMFFKGEKKYVLLSVISALLFLLSLFLFPYVLVSSMGYRMALIPVLEFSAVITFITYAAITPGAAGIAEGAFALIFSGFISASSSTTLTFLWRFFTVYAGSLFGMGSLYYLMIRLKANDKNQKQQLTQVIEHSCSKLQLVYKYQVTKPSES